MIDEYKMYNRVIVELLENEAIEDFSKVKKFIEIVRRYGVQIAIDDFGSGYSNFIYLAEIHPDFIKIDGSLIKNIHTHKKSLIIAKNINNFAKELGCKTIAEFVHNKDVFDIVKGLDVDGIQGYYLAEPKEEI
jgi:EAL domain-containing protein (putative c-di-GMP-specific phosphodiesterase class I)